MKDRKLFDEITKKLFYVIEEDFNLSYQMKDVDGFTRRMNSLTVVYEQMSKVKYIQRVSNPSDKDAIRSKVLGYVESVDPGKEVDLNYISAQLGITRLSAFQYIVRKLDELNVEEVKVPKGRKFVKKSVQKQTD